MAAHESNFATFVALAVAFNVVGVVAITQMALRRKELLIRARAPVLTIVRGIINIGVFDVLAIQVCPHRHLRVRTPLARGRSQAQAD